MTCTRALTFQKCLLPAQPHLASSLQSLAAYNHFAEAVAAQAAGNLELASAKMSQFNVLRSAAAAATKHGKHGQILKEQESSFSWPMPTGHAAYSPHTGMHARWMEANSAMCEGEKVLGNPRTSNSSAGVEAKANSAGGVDAKSRFVSAEHILRTDLLDVPGALDAALKISEVQREREREREREKERERERERLRSAKNS